MGRAEDYQFLQAQREVSSDWPDFVIYMQPRTNPPRLLLLKALYLCVDV